MWIGWDDATRGRNLQRVVNNSRFLILPWVRVQNLASRVLSLMARQLPCEWHSRYGVEPLLLETLVDHSRYRGTCYRAANWIELGVTTGRGRMDREHRRHGASWRCCTARSKSLTSLCRLQSHPAQYVSGIPSAAILLSISHPIGVVAPLWLRAKSAYGGGRGMFRA